MPKKPADPIAKARRAIAGSRAKANGDAGEEIVAQARAYAFRAGAFRIDRVPTPSKPIGNGRWVPDEKSTVDGVGFVLDGSAGFIAEEVKAVDEPGPFYLSRVEDHQKAFLDAVDRAGGIAMVTVVLLRQPKRRLSVWGWWECSARTSIPYEELLERAVPIEGYAKAVLG